MYLSRIELNTALNATKQLLASPHMLHGAVERCFPGPRQRNLWRVDQWNHSTYLLLLSSETPEMAHIAAQYGDPRAAQPCETKPYEALLNRLAAEQIWRFRLCANPVRSSAREKDAGSGRGKVFSHVTSAQQKQWLMARAASCGFSLEEDAFDVVGSQWYRFRKGSNSVSVNAVTFEGALAITDVEAFKHTLINGIGRAKAYGCGMLTIARGSR